MPTPRRLLPIVLAAALTALGLGATTPAADAAVVGSAIRITEFAYGGNATGAAGGDGEYAELTNIGDTAQDLTGWTYETGTTASATTGLSLTSLGTVAPGESVIVTDLSAAEFRTDWGLKSSVKVLSNAKAHTLNSGPSGIHVFSGAGVEVDSVTYLKGFFPGKGSAAWVDAAHVGAKSGTTGWTLAAAADAEGSWTSATGAVGSPGASTLGTKTPTDVRAAADVKITEFAYGGKTSSATGGDGEYVELTNVGGIAQDLTGWKYDNSAATFSTALPMSSLGSIAPGESVIVTDITDTDFRADWGLLPAVKVLNNGKTHTLNGGPNSIHIYNSAGTEVDSVSYAAGFQSAKGQSAWVDAAHVGAKAGTTGWTISTVGDHETSWTSATGSIGSPGASTLGTKTPADVRTGGTGTGPEAPCDTENAGTAAGTLPTPAAAWPGSQTPATIDAQCAWVTSLSGQDLSGLAFDPSNANLLYAVKNKSHVYRLVRSGGTWVKDTTNGWSAGKDIRFPGNAGLPDSEGLAVGPDGALYITTERDNAASGTPLDSILKFDPMSTDTTLVATDQWVLTSDLDFTASDANLGFEGVAYVPDSFLTASGFRTDAGALYNPASYPGKVTTGLFFGAVEKTGHLRAYVLNADHSFVRVADISTGMAGVMDASYDPDLGRIWAHCDNTCGNATALLKLGADGHFAVDRYYSTPTGLPNYNLEGFAVAPASTATNGTREVLWTDDGNRFGHSLWSGTVNLALGLSQTSTPTPTIGGSAVFGQSLTAGPGSWDPGVTTHYVWKDGGTVLATDTPLALNDPALVGKTITLAVTGSRTGFNDATTSTTTTVAAATLTGPTPSIAGAPAFGQTLAATVGDWGSGVTTHYVWKDGATVLATDAPLALSDPALIGRTITLAVTGTKAGYTAATTTATTTVAAAALTAPAPTVTGTPAVGQTLTAGAAWGPDGVQLAYAWLADGQPIAGATGSTLRLGAAQVGAAITVRVTGTKAGYATATAASGPTAAVQPGTISTSRPTIDGAAKVGRKLKVDAGAWSAGGGAVDLEYQWYANGKKIKHEDGAKLKVDRSLRGKKITVVVTGSADGYTTADETSKKVKVQRR